MSDIFDTACLAGASRIGKGSQTDRIISGVIAGAHAYALLVFGATFWIDSAAYVSLADALRSAESLAKFYNDCGFWFYGHVEPGVPIIWLLATRLPTLWQWPAFAFFQHALAASALYFTFATLNKYWPTRWHILSCLIICFLPFYQSFHNNILTESITSSLFMIAVALGIRLILEPSFSRRTFFLLLAAQIVITQFRGNYGPLVMLLAVIVVWTRKKHVLVNVLFILFSSAVALLAFPVYRGAATGSLFVTRSSGLKNLVLSSMADPVPSNDVMTEWSHMPLPADMSLREIKKEGLRWPIRALELGRYWEAAGLSREAVDERAQKISNLYHLDHFFLFRQRLALASTVLGFVSPLYVGDSSVPLILNYTADEYAKHCIDGYRWHARISLSDYTEIFATFFQRPDREIIVPNSVAGCLGIENACRCYLSKVSVRFRDPLFLGSLPPDIWAAVGVLSMVLVSLRYKAIGLLLLVIPSYHFVVSAFFPLGGLRYGYALFPIYLISFSLLIGSQVCDGDRVPRDLTRWLGNNRKKDV